MSDDAATISRYLLHDLPPDQQEAVERRYFADPDYLALVDAVEGDLIDAYVRHRLPRSQRQQFETFFLRTRARRERVRMAEALAEEIGGEARTSRVPWLAAAAILIVLFGGALWMWPRAEAPQVVQKPVATRTPVTMAVVLMPGLTRSTTAPRKVTIPANVEQVQLRAFVDVEGEWRDLHASLRTADGADVWSADHLAMDREGTVVVDVPAKALPSGELMLVIAAKDEVLGDYPFFSTRP